MTVISAHLVETDENRLLLNTWLSFLSFLSLTTIFTRHPGKTWAQKELQTSKAKTNIDTFTQFIPGIPGIPDAGHDSKAANRVMDKESTVPIRRMQ